MLKSDRPNTEEKATDAVPFSDLEALCHYFGFANAEGVMAARAAIQEFGVSVTSRALSTCRLKGRNDWKYFLGTAVHMRKDALRAAVKQPSESKLMRDMSDQELRKYRADKTATVAAAQERHQRLEAEWAAMPDAERKQIREQVRGENPGLAKATTCIDELCLAFIEARSQKETGCGAIGKCPPQPAGAFDPDKDILP